MFGTIPTVYLAGPIAGCSWDIATDWRKWVQEQLPDCEVLSPLRAKEHLKDRAKMPLTDESHPTSGQHAIVMRDHRDVCRADAVLANLIPSRGVGTASIGTCFELAWCYHLRKPAVVVMQNTGNPNSHPFVYEAAYVVVNDLKKAVGIMRGLLNLSERPLITPRLPEACELEGVKGY